MMDWLNEDYQSQRNEKANQKALKLVDQYFDQCSFDKIKNIKSNDYRICLLDPDIYFDDEVKIPPPSAVSPIISFVNKILSRAIQQKVQQVRLVPLSVETLIRFNRGQGFYEPFQHSYPQVIMPALANRIRLIAGMAMLPHDQPVIGKLNLSFQDNQQQEKQAMFAIYGYPSHYGESLLLKIIPAYYFSSLDEMIDIEDLDTDIDLQSFWLDSES